MIDLGDIYQVAVDIRDAAGVLTNPATATLTITLLDGTTTTPSVTLPPTSTGQLRVDYTTVQAGRHGFRMVTTGPTTAHVDVFDVREATPPMIVSLAAAKKQLNIPVDKTTDDEEIRGHIEGITGAIEDYVGAVPRRTEVENFDGGQCAVLLSHIPLILVTSVVDSGATLTASDYKVNTRSGVLTRIAGTSPYPFQAGVQSVAVTYVAGRAVIPANIILATMITLQHIWETQRPAGGGPFSQQSDDFDPRYTYSLPRRALELLGDPIGGVA